MRRRNNRLHPDDRIRQAFWRNPEFQDSQAYFLRRSDWFGGVWRLLVYGKPRSSWSHNAKGTLLALSMIAHLGEITSMSKPCERKASRMFLRIRSRSESVTDRFS